MKRMREQKVKIFRSLPKKEIWKFQASLLMAK